MPQETPKNDQGGCVRARMWQCSGHKNLTGHEPFLQKCMYLGTIEQRNEPVLRFWAQSYKFWFTGQVTLYGAMFDTSVYEADNIIKKRFTWYSQVDVVNAAVLIMPFDPIPFLEAAKMPNNPERN